MSERALVHGAQLMVGQNAVSIARLGRWLHKRNRRCGNEAAPDAPAEEGAGRDEGVASGGGRIKKLVEDRGNPPRRYLVEPEAPQRGQEVLTEQSCRLGRGSRAVLDFAMFGDEEV